MSIAYAFDLYPRTNPVGGARVRRLSQLQDAEYRGEANGTGAGWIMLRGTSTDAAYIDPKGMQYIRQERLGDAVTLALSAAADDIIDTAAAHGYAAGNKVEFVSLTGGAGLSLTPVYYVKTVPTTTSLTLSATRGGSGVNFTTDVTTGTIRKLTTIGGFFLENGDYEALTEHSTKKLTFGGAGTLSYLARDVMAPHTYADIAAPLTAADDPYDDLWRLYLQGLTIGATANSIGAILWRLIAEAQGTARPYHYLADVTMTFDPFVDTDSNSWMVETGDFTAQINESIISVVQRLMQAGLYVYMDPDTFELSAWETANHGRDRTGVAWGTNVVRFQAPTDGTIATGNIKSDAKRGIGALINRTALWVGADDNYALVTQAGDVGWAGGYRVQDESGASFAAVGAAQLAARNDAGDTVRLRLMLGNAPTTGAYLPFEHVLLDDTVTLHTGSGQWDWDETSQKVAAITLKLRPAGDWDAWVDLGSKYSSIEQRAFANQPVGAHTHPPNPRLCDPAGGLIEGDETWRALSLTYRDGGGTVVVLNAEPADWKDIGFDDSAWVVPTVAPMSAPHPPFLMRHPDLVGERRAEFILRREYTVAAADLVGTDVVFKHRFDDGGVLYINGIVIVTVGSPFGSETPTTVTTTIPRSAFVTGLNCVAIYAFNQDAGSVGSNPPGDHMVAPYIEMPVDGFAAVGSSPRAARCDHPHHHNELLGRGGVQQHPASGITETTDGDVQTALDNLRASGSVATDLSPSGSVSNIATTPNYLSFPGVAKLDAAHLVAVWRQGTDHATTQDGIIKYAIGTIAADHSVSWGSVTTLYDDPSLDCRDPEVMVTSSGTVICSFFLWDGSTTYALRVARAGWDGSALTWGSPIAVSTSYSVAVACSAKVVELFNGDLLLPFYGRASGSVNSCSTIKSTDGGATWGSQVTIVTGTVGAGNNWTEPYMVLLADGTLHCLIREDTDDTIYRTTSSDGGATWAAVAIAFLGDARPAHIQVQSGGLLYVSRASDGSNDTQYRISTDYGVTWSGETIIDSAGSSNGYASIVQIDHYRYGVIYGIENSSTDADIKWVLFTDAAVLDIIGRLDAATAAGVTDHGALTGLADDDHPQYLTEAEHAALDPTTFGHYEVIVSGTAPPVAVTNEAEDDWVYGWVS